MLAREIDLECNGVDYKLSPSIKAMCRIEAGLAPSSFVGVLNRVQSGQPPVFEVAYIVSELYRLANAPVTNEEVYAILIEDIASEGKVFGEMCKVISALISPTVDVAKKSLGGKVEVASE